MTRLAVLVAILALVAPAVLAAPAMQTGALPRWETSASGPLHPLPEAGGSSDGLGDLVVTCQNFEINAYSHVGPITGDLRFTVPYTTAQGWTGYALEGQSAPADVGGVMSQEYVICDPATSGNLVMIFNYGSEFLSIQDLYTDHPSVKNYFGSYSGTISFARVAPGPNIPTTPSTLAGARRNWYAPWLLATNPPLPAASGHTIALDALVLPEGLYCTSRAASEIIVAERPMIDALVGRYRAGLAPAVIPVNVDHAAPVTGRVTRVWAVAGSGLWARIEADQAAVVGKRYLSAEMRCLTSTATDSIGAWGTFSIPWHLTGVALTDDPAIAGTHYELRSAPAGAYPDPRTVNDTWKLNR